MKGHRKETHFFLPIILIIILLISIYFIFSSQVGEGVFILEIKNTNLPCNSNNTSDCDQYIFSFKALIIDGENVTNGTNLIGEKSWIYKMKLSEGKHSFKIIQDAGSLSKNDIHISANKKTCIYIGWSYSPQKGEMTDIQEICSP